MPDFSSELMRKLNERFRDSSLGRYFDKLDQKKLKLPIHQTQQLFQDACLASSRKSLPTLYRDFQALGKQQDIEIKMIFFVNVSKDNRFQLILWNFSERAYRVRFGNVSMEAMLISPPLVRQCSDGMWEPQFTMLDYTISGKQTLLMGQKDGTNIPPPLVCPIDLNHVPLDDIRTGMVDLELKLDVEGDELYVNPHWLFGAEETEGAEFLKV